VDRDDQERTWITPELIKSFGQLHEKGYAHSVEVWQDEELVGGLYGLAIGKIFFGESMFTKASNASKFALIALCKFLHQKGFEVIDCQQETAHLMSMGAELISKEGFFERLKKNLLLPDNNGKWAEVDQPSI
jgi:leucyl/phenylalanyl-tRNA--protein transferase